VAAGGNNEAGGLAPLSAYPLPGLPTPCLVVDAVALARNLRRAADFFMAARTKLRPHFKAHKCTTLLRRQLEAGGCTGVTCATAAEALILADSGFEDILIANQVADPKALAAVTRAARRAHVTVAVDCQLHVDLLGTIAATEDVELDVLVEVDVGLHRCGLPPDSPDLIPLARAVTRAPGLTFAGLQGYEGHAVFVPERARRRELVQAAAQLLDGERGRLGRAGFECRLISGGGTGTYDLATEAGVLDEIQAGSYALMDGRYGSIDLVFEPALYCLTSVISRQDDRAVVDAGLKSLSAEYGLPQPTRPDVACLDLSDEHLQLRVAREANLAVGDRITLVPAHVDPTVNLHDTLFAIDRDEIEAWPIDGRRTYAGCSG
jgi:D-serine deaminase-like pyridoxal phosphate-dependent protein